jgi:hypothetical protein
MKRTKEHGIEWSGEMKGKEFSGILFDELVVRRADIEYVETVAQPQAQIPTSSIKYSEVFFAFGKSVFLSKSGLGRWLGYRFLLENLFVFRFSVLIQHVRLSSVNSLGARLRL